VSILVRQDEEKQASKKTYFLPYHNQKLLKMNTTKYLYLLLLYLIVSGSVLGQSNTDCTVYMGYSHESPDEIISIKVKHHGKQTYTTESAARYGNTVVYGGDVVITHDYYGEMMEKGNISSNFSSRWENSTMPYEFDSGLSFSEIIKIQGGIDDVNNETNLCLVERTNESSYIVFRNAEDRCYVHYIGDSGQSAQVVNIGNSCGKRAVIHEILHKAGMYHEQTRPDRDQYISVNWVNLDGQDWVNQFTPQGPETSSGAYDFGSIMHYPQYHQDVTINDNEPAFWVLNPDLIPNGVTIGAGQNMSDGDIFAVNTMYQNSCSSSGGQASNDECNDATPIFDGDCISADAAGATQSYPPEICSGIFLSETAYDVWFSFVALSDSAIIEVTPSYDYDPAIALYSACSIGSSLGCVDEAGGAGDVESGLAPQLNIGETYYIRVYNYELGYAPAESTTFDICLNFIDNGGGGQQGQEHDFYIENLTTDTNSYNLGDAIEIDCDQVTNNPDAEEVTVWVEFTLRTLSNNIVEVFGDRSSSLGDGDEDASEGVNDNIPNSISAGQYKICAEANYDNSAAETNPNNNLECKTITITDGGNGGQSCDTPQITFFEQTINYDTNGDAEVNAICNQIEGIDKYYFEFEINGQLHYSDYSNVNHETAYVPCGSTVAVRVLSLCLDGNETEFSAYEFVTTECEEEGCPDINLTSNIENQNCNTQGSITLTPTGGQAPYTYVWSNGQTGNTITENAGTYTATITDANGCTTNGSFTIESTGTNLSINVQSTNATCDNQGSATATTSGGQAPFTYTWNDGYEGEDRPNLPNGTYTLTVTDANGCTAQQSVTITGEGTPLTLFQTENPSTCEGGTGNALVSATGGNGNYTFAWSNGATTPQISNVLAGTYTVTVNDSNGCSATTSVEIMNEEFTIDCVIPQNATCGASDGEILVKMLNATPPLTYLWSNGTTINPATGLGAGNHTVSITDGNGCTITTSGYINYDVPMYEFVTTPISCAGESDGAVEVYPTGGTPPFTYTWANGETGPYLNNLGAGTYNVMISDANGCNSSRTVTIEAPQPMSVNLALTADQCGISANPNGGTSPYIYTWANGETTNELTDIQGDNTYRLTITDANGCTHTDSLYIPIDAGMPDTNFDYLIENGRLMLMGNPNMTNEWLVDSKWSSNITNPQFPAIPGTMVMVQYTITNPCGSVTTSEMIEIPNSITALDDSEILTGIQISPNPFNDYLLIDMGTLRGEFELRIYNALGQVIFTQNERITNAQLPINPSIRASGMYHLSIIEKHTQRIFTQKIVKVN